jgi:hypothetical protein
MRDPSILQADASTWLAYVAEAPAIRLNRLEFAFDSSHPETVLIRGTPLSPIPGTQFVEEEAVAMPAGLCVWPAVSPAVIRSALAVDSGELVLLRECGDWLRLPRTAWIPATRNAVRQVLASHF